MIEAIRELLTCFLMLAGAVNNSRKTINPGKTLGTFALGTRRLFEFMNENPVIEMHPVDYINDPCLIGKIDNDLRAIDRVERLAPVGADRLGQGGVPHASHQPGRPSRAVLFGIVRASAVERNGRPG